MLKKRRMKPQNTQFSGQIQLNTQNIVNTHVTLSGNPVAYCFVILFEESWMIKTSVVYFTLNLPSIIGRAVKQN